jgi:hypothetical protein
MGLAKRASKTREEQIAHRRFVRALHHEALTCATPKCPGPIETTDLSQHRDRVKVFEAKCQACGWQARLAGQEESTPPWDEATLLMMADEHLMHQQPLCPFDDTPVLFHSLPNPRRKAKYRLSCFYCGRQADINWPPPEAKR